MLDVSAASVGNSKLWTLLMTVMRAKLLAKSSPLLPNS